MPEKLEITLKLEKETRNTFRYGEVEDPEGMPPAIGTLYVQKFAAKRIGSPEHVKVTVEAVQ